MGKNVTENGGKGVQQNLREGGNEATSGSPRGEKREVENSRQAASPDPSFLQQLAKTVAVHDIKVLILHGTGDRVVPLANSVRLAGMLPGAELVELEPCGH